jgi:pimeloyl-ACP methyl ester carboxylesterase
VNRAPDFIDRIDGVRLAYRHVAGAGPTIVFLPGYRSDMTGDKAVALADWAASRGLGALRFDYSGCGESEGDFEAGTLEVWRDDALCVLDKMTTGPLVLVGSSMGGWLMLLIALARPERVKGLVGIATAADFTDWSFSDAERAALQAGRLEQQTPYGTQIFLRDFWESGQRNLLLGQPIPFAGPVHLLHGQCDDVVPWETSLKVAERLATGDVRVTLVKDGDHRLSRPADISLLIAAVAGMVEGQF